MTINLDAVKAAMRKVGFVVSEGEGVWEAIDTAAHSVYAQLHLGMSAIEADMSLAYHGLLPGHHPGVVTAPSEVAPDVTAPSEVTPVASVVQDTPQPPVAPVVQATPQPPVAPVVQATPQPTFSATVTQPVPQPQPQPVPQPAPQADIGGDGPDKQQSVASVPVTTLDVSGTSTIGGDGPDKE